MQVVLSLVPPALQTQVCIAVHLPCCGSLTEIHAIDFIYSDGVGTVFLQSSLLGAVLWAGVKPVTHQKNIDGPSCQATDVMFCQHQLAFLLADG